MTAPAVDDQHTQPVPVCFRSPPPGAIPAQRGPVRTSPQTGGGAGIPVIARAARGVATNRHMPMIATLLTACALLLSIGGTVVTSGATNTAGRDRSSVVAEEHDPAGGPPAHGAVQPATPALAPGEVGGDGIYRVGSEIQPGTYRTAGPSPAAFDNCYWERSRDTSGTLKAVIAKGLVSGPATVTIKKADGAFKSSGCQSWTQVR
jgi:hypothetical protein